MGAKVERVYLSGPMTNKPDFNFPVFDSAQRYLETIGAPDVSYDVISPAVHDRDVIRGKFLAGEIPYAVPQDVPGYATGDVKLYNAATATHTGRDLLAWDFKAIIDDVDAIAMMPGWEQSSGGRAERLVAEQTGKHVYLLTHNSVDWFNVLIDGDEEWCFGSDIQQTRLSDALREWGSEQLPTGLDVSCGPACEDCAVQLGSFRVVTDERMPPNMAIVVPSARFDHLVEGLDDPPTPSEGIRELFDRAVAQGQQGLVDRIASDTPFMAAGEHRVIDPNTGGAKGSKLARYDLVPQDALWVIAEHYGRGARKYADRNWEKGYAWSLSYAALQRHLAQWWQGEDIDPDPSLLDEDAVPRSSHLAAVAWHALALLSFTLREDGTDDRPLSPPRPVWSSADER